MEGKVDKEVKVSFAKQIKRVETMNDPIRPNFDDDTLPLAASLLGVEDFLFDELDDDALTDAYEQVGPDLEIESATWTSSSEQLQKGVEASDALSSLDNDEGINIYADLDKQVKVKYDGTPAGNDRSLPPHEQSSDANCKEQNRKRQASASPPPTPPGSRRRKKEKGKPKRPLSAYNLFFKKERRVVLQEDTGSSDESRKVSFENLAKIIGKRWARLEKADHKEFDELAHKDSIRYRKEMKKFELANNSSWLEQYGLTAPNHIKWPTFPFANTPRSFGNNKTIPSFPSQFSGPPSLVSPDYGPSPPLYPPFSELPEQQQQQLLQNIMQHQIALQQATQSRTNSSSFPQGNQLPQQQLPQQQLPQQQLPQQQLPQQQLPQQQLPQQQLPQQQLPQQLPQQQQLLKQQQQLPKQRQHQQPDAYAPQPTPACPHQQREQPSPCAPQPAPAGDTVGPVKAMDPLRHPQAFPIPLGTEIVLCDHNGVPHKYTVQYTLYSMKRDDAAQYMERLATAFQQVPVESAAAKGKKLPRKIAPRPPTGLKTEDHAS
jgi:hypothetical protein